MLRNRVGKKRGVQPPIDTKTDIAFDSVRLGTPMRVVHDPDYKGVESTVWHVYDNGRVCLCFAPHLAFDPAALEVIRGER